MEVSPGQNEKIHDRPNSCGNISLKPTEILEHEFTPGFHIKDGLKTGLIHGKN